MNRLTAQNAVLNSNAQQLQSQLLAARREAVELATTVVRLQKRVHELQSGQQGDLQAGTGQVAPDMSTIVLQLLRPAETVQPNSSLGQTGCCSLDIA